ncbi:MAG: type 4 pilus major pilin [Limnobacter sp.]|nr:type 4 pilus major pilin [Limnobacter sp.]
MNTNLINAARLKKQAQKGITLVEVSVGLLIAAIVAAAAFVAFQDNSRRQEVRENVAEITVQITEAKQKFGRTVAYDALDTALALQSGTIDQFNSYGGNICMNGAAAGTAIDNLYDACGAGSSVGGPNDVAVLQWDNIPEAQCLDLVTSTLEGSREMYVGLADAAGSQLRTNGVTDLTDLATACDPDPAVDGETVQITWVIPQR